MRSLRLKIEVGVNRLSRGSGEMQEACRPLREHIHDVYEPYFCQKTSAADHVNNLELSLGFANMDISGQTGTHGDTPRQRGDMNYRTPPSPTRSVDSSPKNDFIEMVSRENGARGRTSSVVRPSEPTVATGAILKMTRRNDENNDAMMTRGSQNFDWNLAIKQYESLLR